MVNFKACPRCRGDLKAAMDIYGEYLGCLQCGHVVNIEKVGRHLAISKGRQKPGRPRKTKVGRDAA